VVYFDTSFIAPNYLNEASSEAIGSFLDVPAEQFAVSDWTLAEFASLLARLVRMRSLPRKEALETMRLFEQDARDSMLVIEPVRADFTLARELLLREARVGLRTPDALHLAIAGNRRLLLHTLDSGLLNAAKVLGVSATNANIL
jgi:predicted nucleic acid-binding protein